MFGDKQFGRSEVMKGGGVQAGSVVTRRGVVK